MKPEKTYYCEVDIKFGGNSFEAKSKEEYISKVLTGSIFFDIGYDIIVEHLVPNLIYDRQLTESNQRLSIQQVPRSKGVVLENELFFAVYIVWC